MLKQSGSLAMGAGSSLPGYRLSRAKLTPADVRSIRTTGEHRRKLAARYGVSPQSIDNIRSRRTWWSVA